MSVKHRDSINAKCPFFHAEESQKIYCEGIADGTSIHLAFGSSAEKKAYSAKHCNCDYSLCLVYRMNDSKYDECGQRK